ncbi:MULTISPECIES: hypothetical protein [unclassified Bradyrhizobium]|uniref:hypothetical protein n=1 Tax=unclassified Bradyrhizobium TaxID=2631580 RepID=UPI002915FF2B|nr:MULTISPECIES: hypothetical protein [unclassified Bradyrhizobium]
MTTSEIESKLTGVAFDLANAGYTPMHDPEKGQEHAPIDGDNAALREAAGRLTEAHQPLTVREYVDAKGERAAPTEAVTLARAARDHARGRAADRRAAQAGEAEETAQRVDALRQAVQANDATAADFYGVKHPDGQGDDGATAQAAESGWPGRPSRDGHSSDEIATELEKALQHPQVLQAIEEKIGEAEKARQSYRDGLAAAMQLAQANFLGQFPEFSGMAPDHIPAALEKMSREDPAKFARVQSAVAASEQLRAQQAHAQQHQAEMERQNFQKFAQGEDARLEVMLKDEPKGVRQAVAAEIMAAAKQSGIEPAELNRLFHTEPLMRHATFQRMMYDAAKYRLMMKSKDAIAARPVPPVVRPGVAASSAERERADVRALNARLSSSGDLKDAVALYQARRANRS